MTALMSILSAVSLLASGDIARVGSTAITRGAFEQRAEALRVRGRPPTSDEVLDSLVDEAVLAQEARGLGLGSDPAVAERLDRERRRTVTAAFVRGVAATVKPSEEELRASYHATTDFVRAHVLRYASEEDARAGAARLAGGADLLAEAHRAKSAQVAARDVEAPYLMRAQLDAELAAVLFRGRASELLGPAKVGGDWVVARVVGVAVGDEAGFERARPALYAQLQAKAADAARRHLVSMLHSRVPSSIDDAFLQRATPLESAPSTLQHVVASVGNERIAYSEVVAAARALAASGAGAHASTPETRKQVVRTLVEERLLLIAARERGIDSEPQTQAQLALVERGVLAAAALERIWQATAGTDDRTRADAVRSRVKELRAHTKISVDRAALAGAASVLR